MPNETGRSTPFRLSFKPDSGVTKSGAVTLCRLSSAESCPWKKSLTCFIAICVSLRSRADLYPSGIFISLSYIFFPFFLQDCWLMKLRCTKFELHLRFALIKLQVTTFSLNSHCAFGLCSLSERMS